MRRSSRMTSEATSRVPVVAHRPAATPRLLDEIARRCPPLLRSVTLLVPSPTRSRSPTPRPHARQPAATRGGRRCARVGARLAGRWCAFRGDPASRRLPGAFARGQRLRGSMSGWVIPPPSRPAKSDKDLRRERKAKIGELGLPLRKAECGSPARLLLDGWWRRAPAVRDGEPSAPALPTQSRREPTGGPQAWSSSVAGAAGGPLRMRRVDAHGARSRCPPPPSARSPAESS
jgi:hypothetical protein